MSQSDRILAFGMAVLSGGNFYKYASTHSPGYLGVAVAFALLALIGCAISIGEKFDEVLKAINKTTKVAPTDHVGLR